MNFMALARLKQWAVRLVIGCLAMACARGGVVAAAAEAQGALRIALAGDSTVATNSGWGPAFAQLLKPGAECLNFARGGQSSKSFRDSGNWQKVLDAKPAYILIQYCPRKAAR